MRDEALQEVRDEKRLDELARTLVRLRAWARDRRNFVLAVQDERELRNALEELELTRSQRVEIVRFLLFAPAR